MKSNDAFKAEIASGLALVHRNAPGAALACRALLGTVGAARATPSSEARALVALGLAVSMSCPACARRNVRAAAKAGADRDAVLAALRRGVLMGGADSLGAAASALGEFDRMIVQRAVPPGSSCSRGRSARRGIEAPVMPLGASRSASKLATHAPEGDRGALTLRASE